MVRTCLAAVVLIALTGCARVTTVSHQTVPAELRRAPQPAMQRQVRNAVDAGEGDAVVRDLRRRLVANPDDVKARLELTQRYQDQGFPELAVEHLRLAIARAPHLSELHLRLAKALHASGEDPAAVEALIKFCNVDPQPPAELLSLLGIYEDNLGRSAAAEQHHRRAVELAPKRDVFHNNLGYNLLLQDRPAEAAVEFRRAVELNPRSEIARNNLGTALARSPGGDTREALLQWQAAGGPAAAHNNLATVFIEQQRYAEARKEIETALGYSKEHTAALSNLALVSELDGQPAEVAARPRDSKWHRFSAGVRKALGARPDAAASPSTPDSDLAAKH